MSKDDNRAKPSEADSARAGAQKPTILVCFGLVLIAAAVYWPVVKNGFVNFDDPDYVTSNPWVKTGLTARSIQWVVTGIYSSNWHPITWLSHMIDCEIYGLRPAGHHLTSLLFHLANTVILFVMLKNMTMTFWRSALVAAVFALHPMHVESVAWVSERKDVLSTFFGLLCLWGYSEYVERKSRGETRAAWRCYGFAFVMLALGLMSKPMLVTFPFVMLLMDFWPLRRLPFAAPQPATLSATATTAAPETSQGFRVLRSLVLEKIPFLLLTIASCVITFRVQQISGAMIPLEHTPITSRIANAVAGYGWYIWKTFLPRNLAVFYPHPHFDWISWQVLASLLTLAIVTVLVLLRARKRPYLPVGWFWFLGTLVPVIGLVQVGQQAWADRYSYVPQIGLLFMLVWFVAEFIASWNVPRIASLTVAAVVLLACVALTWEQIGYWRDTLKLFQHAAAVTPNNYIAYAVIGAAEVERGNLSQAIEYCQKALQISPRYPEAYNTLGNIYAKQEKWDQAEASYRQAIECDPAYADPRAGLGSALLQKKNYAEAEVQSREAIKLSPMSMPAMFTLARALQSQGKLDEAAALYRKLLELDAKLFSAHHYLGNVLVAQGKPDEAIVHLQAALKLHPDDADTHAVLGTVWFEKGKTEEAMAEFKEAIRLQPNNTMANYQLALLHQSRNELKEAINYYHQTLASQPNLIDVLNNLSWLLASARDPAVRDGLEAVQLAERACKLTDGKEPLLLGTLAAAYAEAGRFKEATESAEKARNLALAAGQKDIAEKNRQLLELYKLGRAYREGE